MLATIGRKAGVAHILGISFAGFTAWVLWLVVHVFWLIGFRNRIIVLFEWAWAYFTHQRGARVMLVPPLEPHEPQKKEVDRTRSARLSEPDDDS